MNHYGNSNIKQSPLRGLSGMGGGLFIPVGVPEPTGNAIIVAFNNRSNSADTSGTYNATDTQCLLRGYNEGTDNAHNDGRANDGYMQVIKGTSVKVQMWAAAGGSGNSSFPGNGGGGQFVEAQLDFTSGGTLYWMVGAGGGVGKPSNYIGGGGWGGGGSCGFESNTITGGGGSANGPQVGYSGTAFGVGGDSAAYSGPGKSNRGATGGGGGGLVGLFFANAETGQTATNGNDSTSAKCIMTAGGGGGFGGYSNGEPGAGGGESHPNSASANAAGSGQQGAPGGIGFGGGGLQRGGGGGGAYYGGAGGNDQDASTGSGSPGGGGTRQGGGGGYGNVTAQSGVEGINISNTTITAGTENTCGADGTAGHTGEYGCTDSTSTSGRGGLITLTILT